MTEPVVLIGLFVKSAVLLSLAGVVARALRPRSAALRHVVWATALTGLVVLPALEIGPGFEIGWPGWFPAVGLSGSTSGSTGSLERSAPDVVPSPFSGALTGGEPTPGAGQALVERAAQPRFGLLLAGFWGAGILALLGWLALVVHRLRALRRGAVSWLDVGWRIEMADCARILGLPKVPILLRSSEVKIPVAWGARRGVVILPSEATGWSPARRRAVLLHELAHLRRGDLVTSWIGEMARTLFWPNPLAWRALARLRAEAEQACDDLVLGMGIEPVGYARDLLELATGGRGRRLGPALGLAKRKGLAGRLAAILDASTPRSWPGWPELAVVVGVLALALGGLGLARWGVESMHESDRTRALLAELEAPAPVARRRAAWGLGELEAREAVGALAEHLADPDTEVRAVAAWALGEIKDRLAVAPLLAELDGADALAREMVVKALGEIGDPRAASALIALANDPATSEALRGATMWALGEIATRDAFSRIGIALATDPVPWVRVAAAEAFCPTQHAGALEGLIAAMEDESAAVREAAARHLAQSDEPRAWQALIAALEDDDTSVRAEAARSLGKAGTPLAVDALIARLRDEDPDVRAAATWALDEIGV